MSSIEKIIVEKNRLPEGDESHAEIVKRYELYGYWNPLWIMIVFQVPVDIVQSLPLFEWVIDYLLCGDNS